MPTYNYKLFDCQSELVAAREGASNVSQLSCNISFLGLFRALPGQAEIRLGPAYFFFLPKYASCVRHFCPDSIRPVPSMYVARIHVVKRC